MSHRIAPRMLDAVVVAQWPNLKLAAGKFELTIGKKWQTGVPVKDYLASLEKLRADAAECRLICDLATVPAKRESFDRLARHLTSLADQVELAMIEASKTAKRE